MKKTSHAGHTGQAALSALLEISLVVVPALLFFYTYVHHYPSATFFLRGNVLFFVVYFAILVLFMTIYGSFSVRKYRTRELVFAFGLSSFFTDTIAYFLMCMIAKMLLPPKYVILTLLLQCLVETGIFILARILADRLEPPCRRRMPRRTSAVSLTAAARATPSTASFPRICHGRSCARSCTPTLQSC